MPMNLNRLTTLIDEIYETTSISAIVSTLEQAISELNNIDEDNIERYSLSLTIETQEKEQE